MSILNAVLRSNAFGDVANARCEIKQVLFHSPNRNIHVQLLATLIENLFLMFLLRYGQDDGFAKKKVAGQLLYYCSILLFLHLLN